MPTQPAPSYVALEFPLLLRCLAQITDARKARGKVHPLPPVLALTVLGLMAGHASLSAISLWVTAHPRVWQALGLRRAPSFCTLWRLLQLVKVSEMQEALGDFALALRAVRCPAGSPAAAADCVAALDGKTLRGTREDADLLHVLNVFATESALVLDQVEVASHLEEGRAAKAWVPRLCQRFPAFSILTGDAAYAEQSLCAALVAAERHYVLKVKKTNQPSTPTSRNCLRTPATPA
jgi:hypothetical protein